MMSWLLQLVSDKTWIARCQKNSRSIYFDAPSSNFYLQKDLRGQGLNETYDKVERPFRVMYVCMHVYALKVA